MNYCVVVTGAASGIGAAVAAELRAQGETVFAVDAKGGDLTLDLLASGAVEKLGAAIAARYDGVKGFVHCAGFDQVAPLGLIRSEDAARLYALHALFPLQFFGWLQKRANHAPSTGCVLVSSLAAHEGAKAHAAYASANGAVEGLLRPAAAELAPKGIRVNAVVLGVVETAMTRAWAEKLTDARRAALAAEYPLGLGKPESVAKTIAFLLSEDAAWITGQTLVCDGGHLCR